jgi:2-isopropylmalate synthase
VIDAGATTINVPDTVGYTLPAEYGSLFSYLIATVPQAKKVVWSTHCHNDLGLATANTLSAVQAGARQVEVTINGIGERAGNTSLEEVIMAIKTRPSFFPVHSDIDSTQIIKTSRMVSHLTGTVVQPNKAIVGANAFAHESGIHQDGMLKNKQTYEIMTPASVGLTTSNLVLGKHSGRHAFAQRLKELGFENFDAKELDSLVEQFKQLADSKKVITDMDLQAILYSNMNVPTQVWTLVNLHVFTGMNTVPTATATLKDMQGHVVTKAAEGTGPVDAIYNAIKEIVNKPNDLVHFSVVSCTDGTNALGEVTIKISPAPEGHCGKRSVKGLKRIAHVDAGLAGAKQQLPAEPLVLFDEEENLNGASQLQYIGTHADKDILLAAAHAYVTALNRLLIAEMEKAKRAEDRAKASH